MQYDINEHGITQSALTMWRECPTKARLYLSGLSGDGKLGLPIVFGHDFHKAMEIILAGLGVEPPLEVDDSSIQAILDRMWMDDQRIKDSMADAETYEFSAGLAEIMVPRFFSEYGNILLDPSSPSFRKIIATEEEFCEDIFGVGFPIRGKIDGVIVDKNGELWIFEHKTKSRFSVEGLQQTIPRDLQVIVYMTYVYKKYGKLPKGVMYNVIRRPELRQKSSENMLAFLNRIKLDVDARRDHYFQMMEIFIPEASYLRSVEKLKIELKRFRAWVRQSSEDDAQHTNGCQTTYGMCRYATFCNSWGLDRGGCVERDVMFPELDMIPWE